LNNLKTGLLLTLLSVMFVYFGYALGGQSGAMIAFGFAVLLNMGSYWFSDKVVLRMYRCKEVTEAEAPELYSVVADLSQRAMIPMPKVYVMPGPALNAFATGRNAKHAAVAVTEGLLQHMDRSELAGVIAHELSHVKHRDILIGSVAATIAAAISMLASMARWGAFFGGSGDRGGGSLIVVLVVSMFASVSAMLVQMAISRSREFEADAGAARLLGDPQPLVRALQKLEIGAERLPMDANPSTAHMFIVSPLAGGGITRLFSTHPPIAERVSRLQGLVGSVHST